MLPPSGRLHAVIMFDPMYDSYVGMAKRAGAVIRPVRLSLPGFNVPLEELAAAFGPNTKAIMVNTPHNPSGKVSRGGGRPAAWIGHGMPYVMYPMRLLVIVACSPACLARSLADGCACHVHLAWPQVFTREELEAIAALCIKHDVIAICDEVYVRACALTRMHARARPAPQRAIDPPMAACTPPSTWCSTHGPTGGNVFSSLTAPQCAVLGEHGCCPTMACVRACLAAGAFGVWRRQAHIAAQPARHEGAQHSLGLRGQDLLLHRVEGVGPGTATGWRMRGMCLACPKRDVVMQAGWDGGTAPHRTKAAKSPCVDDRAALRCWRVCVYEM